MTDDITVVSAFINLNKNKYNNDYYNDWIRNFLLNLNKNLVVFVSEDYYDFIKDLRKDFYNKTMIIKIKLEEFYMYNYINYLKKDLERDHEKNYHSTGLYMIWNEKLKFIERTINLNPFNTSHFAWCDIGYVRNKDYINLYMKDFPNIKKITENKVYMLNIDFNFTDDYFKDPFNPNYKYLPATIGGGFMIGHKDNLLKMINIYYNKIIPYFIDKDYFIGTDQNLYVALYLSNPDLIKLIRGNNENHYPIPYCEFKWFYFLKYLS